MNETEPSSVEELAAFARQGAQGHFVVWSGARVVCPACHGVLAACDVEVLDTRRLEGAANPDDEGVVFAARCPICHRTATLALGYGPAASGDDLDVLSAIGACVAPK